MSQDVKKIRGEKNTNTHIHKRFLDRSLNRYRLLHILKEHKDMTKILTQ